MTRLSVNINKLATLRNARGGNNPDLLTWAKDIQAFGAHGITVHPRPDERHITRADAKSLPSVIDTEYNIEGYPSREFLDLVKAIGPDQVTFVPDPPHVLTSDAGWDVIKEKESLQEIIAEMKEAGIRTSLFIDTDLAQIKAAAETGANRIELYTERYARGYHDDAARAVAPYAAAAAQAHELGLGVNAGHDLDLHNLRYFAEHVPHLDEVSIGHALVCDALRLGMQNVVELYLKALR